jgi:hypothetical protein
MMQIRMIPDRYMLMTIEYGESALSTLEKGESAIMVLGKEALMD